MNPVTLAAPVGPLPLSGGVVADFSAETWWLTLVKAVFIVVFLIASVILVLWVERRGLARMQTRPGPNVNGPFGLFQAFADAAKLIMKEDFWLKGAERTVYLLAPVIAAFSAFMVYAVIPFGPNVSVLGHSTPLQLTDFPVAVLYVLAITAFGVYGIILGGWSAHSTYPLLGAVRSAAQVISYELAMSLSVLTVFLASGTMSTSGIVGAQTRMWWVVAMMPSFVIYVVSMVGEVNRLPFDLPEAEGELVAGHMVEYSSMKFAWYFLAEYINMFNVSAVCVTLFLGGWRSFVIASFWPGANQGWWPVLWFVAKIWAVMFAMIWTRGTLVRIRYDHFMKLGWKVLIPAALTWFVMVSVVTGVRTFSGTQPRTLLLVLAAVFLVVTAVLVLVPERGSEEAPSPPGGPGELVAPGQVLDAFAGGFPVPPLPGQVLPPSPRSRRQGAGAFLPADPGTAPTEGGNR
ncbi:NADH-quinone oxidoreductase subunit NuoH [uncultured Actinomyces sp.]|uniref:NADH-quinone oxidoreductase subunit NuoH n=1 Tax=uncultured Actinomyces sp. TaxID=249061 RepID=UPI0028DC1648|nr:NADH-quinone oxidoreductase subunit NuoH [uncultured Actinomyces sp.]